MTNKYKLEAGLTLLELIVVMTMIGVLLLAAYGFIRPDIQFQKARDGQARSDIGQIKASLETYYNDNSCYPDSLPFGSQWKVGQTTYMPEVPQGQKCIGDRSTCYIYVSNGSCSQWNVVFAKLENPKQGGTCELASSCLPSDANGQYACVVSGIVDCAYLSSLTFSSLESGSGGSPTSAPVPTPTPTPQGCPVNQRNYACSGSPLRCNSVTAGTGTYCASNCDGAC